MAPAPAIGSKQSIRRAGITVMRRICGERAGLLARGYPAHSPGALFTSACTRETISPSDANSYFVCLHCRHAKKREESGHGSYRELR